MAKDTRPCINFIHPVEPKDSRPEVLRYIRDQKREIDTFLRRLNDLLCVCCPESGEKSTTPSPGGGGGGGGGGGEVPCPEITLNDTLPDGIVGTAYSGSVTASGSTGTYTYAITAGALPAGVTMNSSGVFSGTPTTEETASFTVTATDYNGCTGSRAYSVGIYTSFSGVFLDIQDCNDDTVPPGNYDRGVTGVGLFYKVPVSFGLPLTSLDATPTVNYWLYSAVDQVIDLHHSTTNPSAWCVTNKCKPMINDVAVLLDDASDSTNLNGPAKQLTVLAGDKLSFLFDMGVASSCISEQHDIYAGRFELTGPYP